MVAEAKTVTQTAHSYSVLLNNTKAYDPVTPPKSDAAQSLAQASSPDGADAHVYKPVDPSAVTVDDSNKWIKEVNLTMTLPKQNLAKLRLYDSDKPGFSIPDELFERLPENTQTSVEEAFSVSLSPFAFEIKDRVSGQPIIKTEKRKFVMQDKFKELGLTIKSQNVYGLGLSNRHFTLETGAYTMYGRNRKEGSVYDESLGGQQGPGVHPFIMFKTDDDQFAGIYFAGSAPAQFEVIRFDGYDWTVLNYITIAGSIEAYFILPGSADEVLAAYQGLIGMPAMPPFYSLGFF